VVRETGAGHRYLFNALTEHVAFKELDFSKLKVVTFNYDRSLERYLLLAIQNAYRVAETSALDALKSFEVVHIYGSLSSPRPSMQGHLMYGMEPNPGLASTAAKCIRIMA